MEVHSSHSSPSLFSSATIKGYFEDPKLPCSMGSDLGGTPSLKEPAEEQGVGRGVGVNGMAGIQPWHRVKGSEPCSEQLRSPGLREAKWFVCLFTWICGAV